jgi:hypothetical protein
MYPAGCYIVNGKKYINKLEAYNTALTNGVWPHWNFFEEQFSKKNWTVEPKESLTELYNQRARNIRNEYDYIICWFTGGSDSDNIVHSFLSQGLHIDEIWHRSTLSRHSRRDEGLDAFNAANETRLAVIPRLKEYQSRYPWWKPKVNIFDITELSIKNVPNASIIWCLIKEELKNDIDYCGSRLNLKNIDESQFKIKINEIYNKRKTVLV